MTQSRAARGLECDDATGCVVPPIHLTSTFAFRGFGEKRAYDYTRSGNPTRDLLAQAIAELEEGAGAVVTATGMAAITLVGYLIPGRRRASSRRTTVTAARIGCSRPGGAAASGRSSSSTSATRPPCARRWRGRPRCCGSRRPSNPLLRITDIQKFAALGRASGALVGRGQHVPVARLAAAARPSGADLVVHSTTKYLNGHSDVVGGAVVARDKALHEQLAWWANCLGITGAPFDSFLTLRGLRTLHARLEHHGRNAQALAQWLAEQPNVQRVYYPGLPSHPGMSSRGASRRGFGAVVSIELAGGHDAVRAFVCDLECFSLAESLGRRRESGRASGHDDARGDGPGGARTRPGSPTGSCACRSASRRSRICARSGRGTGARCARSLPSAAEPLAPLAGCRRAPRRRASRCGERWRPRGGDIRRARAIGCRAPIDGASRAPAASASSSSE